MNSTTDVKVMHQKPERIEKGSSLLCSPTDYVVVDLETTGYSPIYDEIIEMCALKVRSNEIVDSFCSLVNRDSCIYVDTFVSDLTGITQEMIDSAPDIKDILPGLVDFIGTDIIVGHNVNFDINFLYDACNKIIGKPLINDFVDTMRISRRLHPEHKHHRLMDLAERYSINYSGAHRSKRDCEITKNCYDALNADILQHFDSYNEFVKNKPRVSHSHKVCAKDISSSTENFDTSHILYDKVCVFTGTLEKMLRKEAMQIVANFGGINADSVTKKTNFLILGCNDYCKSIKDGKSNKQKKAEMLQLQGQDISVISEDVFYDIAGIE